MYTVQRCNGCYGVHVRVIVQQSLPRCFFRWIAVFCVWFEDDYDYVNDYKTGIVCSTQQLHTLFYITLFSLLITFLAMEIFMCFLKSCKFTQTKKKLQKLFMLLLLAGFVLLLHHPCKKREIDEMGIKYQSSSSILIWSSSYLNRDKLLINKQKNKIGFHAIFFKS